MRCWLAFLMILLAVPAVAQDRVALVVTSGGAGDGLRQKGEALSEALFGMGFTVSRLENPEPDDLNGALIRMAQARGTVLFYYGGGAVSEAGVTSLTTGSGSIDLNAALSALTGGTGQQRLAFLDICPPGEGVALSALPDLNDLFLALPSPPGQPCPADSRPLADDILSRITVPGASLAGLFPAAAEGTAPPPGPWARSTLSRPFVFRAADAGIGLTASDYAMLERLPPEKRAEMLALWRSAGIAVDMSGDAPGVMARVEEQVVVTSAQPVVQTADVLGPVTVAATEVLRGQEADAAGLVVLAAAQQAPLGQGQAATTPAALPGTGGLPQPSVILGEVRPELAPLPEVAPGSLDYTDLEARSAMRASDPAQYDRLVLTGAYDPPEAELPAALQTELARMNCYTGRIDGQWGRGSRAALQRYFEAAGTEAAAPEPTVDIFRVLLRQEDVTCPEAVAPPRQERSTTAAAPRRQQQPPAAQTTTTTRTAPAQPQPPARPAEEPRIRTDIGTGAFR